MTDLFPCLIPQETDHKEGKESSVVQGAESGRELQEKAFPHWQKG